ncbi:MAG: hypothetical protein GY798_02495 [Hyphomicrobiales bacterium]|nr:hypothetical protein [Hyphomicrobiales bacterium]
MTAGDLIVGVDAGTSVIKAAAFQLDGRLLAASVVRNAYTVGTVGSATQPLPQTWADCSAALRGLGERVDDLALRVAALALTGQGDGTWLADRDNEAVAEGGVRCR